MSNETFLLERSEERLVLDSAISTAIAGSGQFVIIEGSAGLGKSTMLSTARSAGKVGGMSILRARGTELEGDFSFGVVRQLFDPVLFTPDQERLQTLLAGAAAQTMDALGADTTGEPLRLDSVPFGMLHGLYWFTANLCAEAPLMICIDDLQCCDIPSLRFLAFLLARLEELPLLVVAAIRTGDPVQAPSFLRQVVSDRLIQTVQLRPLSMAGSRRLISTVHSEPEDETFTEGCFKATGGNPMLLRELLRIAAEEDLPANGDGWRRLLEFAPQIVKGRVGLGLSRLGSTATEVARVVAVLGDADARSVADLTELGPQEVSDVAERLVKAEILAPLPIFRFVHPLVQSAVYDGMHQFERQTLHAAAARLVASAGEPPEKIGQHLLRSNPFDSVFIDGGFEVATLRAAATAAWLRGSPDTAIRYLKRCLNVSMDPAHRAGLLAELGRFTFQVAPTDAIDVLRSALEGVDDVTQRATLSDMLADALFLSEQVEASLEVWRKAIDGLDETHRDLRQLLQVNYFNALTARPIIGGDQVERDYLEELRRTNPSNGLGGKALDCLLAQVCAVQTREPKEVAERARRSMTVDFITELGSFHAWSHGAFALMETDLGAALPHLDAGVAAAHQHGSVVTVGRTLALRGIARLWQGILKDAEDDFRAARSAIDAAGDVQFRPNLAYLGEVLLEQGHLAEASSVLEDVLTERDVPRWGAWWWYLRVRGRLRIAQGFIEDGVNDLLTCGEWAEPQGYTNPAFVPWRSDAALGLHFLARSQEARTLMDEELRLAHHWGEPRILGRALRVAGQITNNDSCLDLLRESVDVLAPSLARLEYAKSLAEFGAALRRAGKRVLAKDQLTHALEVADRCGARPLSDQVRTDLRAAGGRPLNTYQTGVDALTVSERRVADLAAAGYSNREIAQRLFITAKTVEVHLSGTYRKLGIERRTQLAQQLIA